MPRWSVPCPFCVWLSKLHSLRGVSVPYVAVLLCGWQLCRLLELHIAWVTCTAGCSCIVTCLVETEAAFALRHSRRISPSILAGQRPCWHRVCTELVGSVPKSGTRSVTLLRSHNGGCGVFSVHAA